jgi:HKD family nuclease
MRSNQTISGRSEVILLPTARLLEAFEELSGTATHIDIAVAWVGPSPALELLREAHRKRRTSVRIAVGLSGNATNPEALLSLQEFADLRIGEGGAGIFHPKFYLFRSPTKTTCWVGSANLTLSGLVLNSELMTSFADDGSASQWFAKLWKTLSSDPSAAISQYVSSWKRRPGGAPRETTVVRDMEHPIELLRNIPKDWNAYVSALRECDAYWKVNIEEASVLSPEWSWMETIAAGSDMVRRGNWNNLSPEESNILLAFRRGEGAWGLLGSMKGAATAIGAFLKNQDNVRQTVHQAVSRVLAPVQEDAFITAALRAIHDISKLDGFGPAIATRLIALARPDRGVSVNDGSAPGLHELTGFPKTPQSLSNDRNYPRLLHWVYEQPWYSVSEPHDSFERTIWTMRAALIDSFVYSPTDQ